MEMLWYFFQNPHKGRLRDVNTQVSVAWRDHFVELVFSSLRHLFVWKFSLVIYNALHHIHWYTSRPYDHMTVLSIRPSFDKLWRACEFQIGNTSLCINFRSFWLPGDAFSKVFLLWTYSLYWSELCNFISCLTNGILQCKNLRGWWFDHAGRAVVHIRVGLAIRVLKLKISNRHGTTKE